MNQVRKLSLITALLVLFLVSVGGFVRVAGAGLGCPDWPLCWGRWIPPTHVDQIPSHIDASQFNFAKAWIEYINRLVGVVIGLSAFVTVLAAWRHARDRAEVLGPILTAFVLIGFQGWFGSLVVSHELDPRFVSVHMVLAMLVIGLLILATERATPESRPKVSPQSHGLTGGEWRGVQACLLFSVIQFVVGALVRGSLETVAAADSSLPRDRWLGEVGLLDYLHREIALVTVLTMAWTAWRLIRSPRTPDWVRKLAWSASGLTGLQIVAGLVLAYGGLPPTFQLIHLTVAAWLFAALFWLWTRLRLAAV